MAGVINEPGQHSEQSPATLGAAMDADRNTTRDATRIRLHLGRRTRKAVLTFHIATAGSWLGSTSSSPSSCSPVVDRRSPHRRAQLRGVTRGRGLATAHRRAVVPDQRRGARARHPLRIAALLGVAVKLAINVVFVTLVPLALEPAVSQAVTESRVTADGHVTADVARNLLFPPIVSPTGLLIAMILAVFKPWGRIGARRRRAPS